MVHLCPQMHTMAKMAKICQSLANMLRQSKGFPLKWRFSRQWRTFAKVLKNLNGHTLQWYANPNPSNIGMLIPILVSLVC